MIKHPKNGTPYLTQDGRDRESGPDQYIANMCDSALAGSNTLISVKQKRSV